MHDSNTGAAPAVARRYPVVFNGSGGEYFRIWIVNLLLTILTLGIYSAWAKVRKLRYFYRNTEIDGSVFDYHGRPGAILKGRLVALLRAHDVPLEPLARLFEAMEQAHAPRADKGARSSSAADWTRYLSTHPVTAERVRELRAAAPAR